MNKTAIFSIVLVASVALGAMDFFLNNYSGKTNLQASVQTFVENNQGIVSEITNTDETVTLAEAKEAQSIFNKIDITKIENFESANEMLFVKNNQNFFKLYTFQFESSQNQISYLKIKDLFKELKQEQANISINEVDNYGVNSFYVNDTQDETMARIIILTPENVIGVEHSKTIDKESIEPLLSILTN